MKEPEFSCKVSGFGFNFSPMSSIRSFIAIDIPLSIKKSLSDWIEPFRQRDSSIKWVGPEKMHVTLKFLGNVEEERFEKEFYPEVPPILQSINPIKLVVNQTGQFPAQGIPRVLWAGLEGEIEALVSLVLKLENLFEHFGFVKEKRLFTDESPVWATDWTRQHNRAAGKVLAASRGTARAFARSGSQSDCPKGTVPLVLSSKLRPC